MVGRTGRGLLFAGFLAFAGAAPGLAQGTLAGELRVADVAGYVVIACFADAELGCDEARSGLVEIAGGGTRAAWTIEGLERGPFLVFGWRDVDGDGEAQENELLVLRDGAGEPLLVTAPAAGLLLRAPDAPDGPFRRSPLAPVGSPPATPATPNPTPATPAPTPAPPAPAPVAPSPPAAGLHPDLVGVWQQTRASAGDYRDLSTNTSFSMTSGFSTMLKLRPDGTFLFQFYSSGVAPNCAFVRHFDTAVGYAAFEGGALVLRPTERSIEFGRCVESGTYEPGLDPIVMPAQLTESFDMEGHRTWKLALEGGPVPLELTLLHRPPSPTPPQPVQPADFVLGSDPPYAEMRGVWSTYPHTDLGFFDPGTNAWYLPEYNGAQHLWLRITDGGYDLARAWRDYGYEGVCKKDYVYYERGQAQVASLEDIGGQGNHFRGHARFVADDVRLLVQIRECGADDGATLYTLTPQVSYYAWRYMMATNYISSIPERFALSCPWSRSEWQFMVCDSWSVEPSFGRR